MREGFTIKIMRYASHIVRFLFNRVAAIATTSCRSFSNNYRYNWGSSMNLTNQQEQVLKAISDGRSVFITGSAGTGKSIVLLQAINRLRQTHQPHEVFVTASTGVSACALNGQTLHSFAGVRIGNGDREFLFKRVAKNKQASSRWKTAKALVIDEVSMISGEFFDDLEYIARKMRPRVKAPWGGIQLIVSGDFFQLPPIIDDPSSVKEFAFEAECWNASFDLQVELSQVFRQSDSELIDLLQGIRRGRKDNRHLRILSQCCSNRINSSLKVPRLYPRNQDVKRVNDERLRSLGGEIITYRANDSGEEPWKSQLKQGIGAEELNICLGARVMLVKNKDLEIGLVNGATGTVTDFVKQEGGVIRSICSRGLLPKVRFDSGLEMVIPPDRWDVMEGEVVLATRRQVPLILAWALSIHKCQGMTLDSLHTDLSRVFGCGMVYVALSRVRSLDGLHLSGFDSSKIMAHPKVLQFYENLESEA